MTTEQQDLLDRAMVQLTLLAEAQTAALLQLGFPAATESAELGSCLRSAREKMRESLEHANHARRALRLAGARIPSLDDKPREEKYDLAELAALDSVSGHALLLALDALQSMANRYDADRGKVVMGEGADFGEGIAAMRSRLRQFLGVNVGAGRE